MIYYQINMIRTNFQDRNNGSDQDSDSIYTTNQQQIVVVYNIIIAHLAGKINKKEWFYEHKNEIACTEKEAG